MEDILDPQSDVSVSNNFGFPELRILDFDKVGGTGVFGDDHDHLIAFRYFCENSPKLEEIFINVTDAFDNLKQMHTVCDSVAKSIGPLLNRTALRTLEIRIPDCYEIVNISIMNLIKCPSNSVKPKLERLVLSPLVSLSSIYEFVNMNFNLKSFTITQIPNDRRWMKEGAIQALIRILDSNNELDEIRLGGLGKIYRHKFAHTISMLKRQPTRLLGVSL